MAGSPASRPPRIARPSGAFASLPRSRASAIGIMAKKAARAVIVTGRTRIDAALRIASVGRQALLTAAVPGRSRSSAPCSTTLIPTMKMNPSSDCTLTAVPVR